MWSLECYQDFTKAIYSHIWKNAPPLGSHVFQAKVTIFELIKDISGMNLLSKFHEDRKINVASRDKCPASWRPCFSTTGIIFELVQDIIGMNLLTKFHEDQTINVASTIYSHIRKNAPPLGSHVIQANVTIFELIQDIIKTRPLDSEQGKFGANRPTDQQTDQQTDRAKQYVPHYYKIAWTKIVHGRTHRRTDEAATI
ncbi:hypothetical protein DPMN_138313 [Dreissena polymorpha]|uniref:Uncharacterized protein n=1 Tax=Dreissena polymorpha TaxID=45954 RepID=A0A9D4JEI8_DREPO|nr:hypothetical protein DPMN_138313 [Dreissena polymorpha]